MAGTLLIGTRKTTWREWLKRELGGRDLIVLDPADPNHGPPARVSLVRREKVVDYRFIGSLDASRNPIAVIQGLVELLRAAGPDVVVQSFSWRAQPVVRQMLMAAAQLMQPAEILTAPGVPGDGWPIGPHEIELETSFAEMVQSAQRVAQWMKMLEMSQDHTVPIHEVTLWGARLGSGERVSSDGLSHVGVPGILHAERSGTQLLLVSRRDLNDREISQALNFAQTAKVQVVDPMAYSGRLCSFARQDGEDFGMGMVEELDLVSGTARVVAMAIPPAPVRILKLGSLVIDSSGREIRDDKPWSF